MSCLWKVKLSSVWLMSVQYRWWLLNLLEVQLYWTQDSASPYTRLGFVLSLQLGVRWDQIYARAASPSEAFACMSAVSDWDVTDLKGQESGKEVQRTAFVREQRWLWFKQWHEINKVLEYAETDL